MNDIIWSHEKRLVKDLKPFVNNPRTITKEKFKELIKKIKKNGYINRLIITKEGEVLGGNQRLQALQQLGYTEIDVLVPNVALSKEQAEEINVSDNLSSGAWDVDILGNLFDAEQLIEWGMPESMFNKKDSKETATEISTDNFDEFKHKCPRCGFEFD